MWIYRFIYSAYIQITYFRDAQMCFVTFEYCWRDVRHKQNVCRTVRCKSKKRSYRHFVLYSVQWIPHIRRGTYEWRVTINLITPEDDSTLPIPPGLEVLLIFLFTFIFMHNNVTEREQFGSARHAAGALRTRAHITILQSLTWLETSRDNK